MTSQIQSSALKHSVPWWRYGHVWLLLGLLGFAVAASLGLLYAAISASRTDGLYSDPLHPQDGSAPKVTQAHMLPAEEASRHAATGGIGAPSLIRSAPHSGTSPNAPVDD